MASSSRRIAAREKEATRALDAVAAQRRRLPMVKFEQTYVFDSPTGKKSLLDLFDGRTQLVVYQFMDNGPDKYCPGCTKVINNVPIKALEALAERGVSWATVSNMPLSQIEAYKARMGLTYRSCRREAHRLLTTAEQVEASRSAYFCAMATTSTEPTSRNPAM